MRFPQKLDSNIYLGSECIVNETNKLNMTWKQAARYICEHHGRTETTMSLHEQLQKCVDEMGYEVNIFKQGEKASSKDTVTLYREGIESHVFFGDDCSIIACEFLRAELIYNAVYYPQEEKPWRLDGLKAFSCRTNLHPFSGFVDVDHFF
jgi:hypothetical protein